jgi:hypothetical protein
MSNLHQHKDPMTGKFRRTPAPCVDPIHSLRARFEASIDRNGVGGCWLWTRPASGRRYVSLGFEGRLVLAHRVSWFLHHGEWPAATMVVCHHCDVTLCVNPDHLFIGTQRDNMRDARSKGRWDPTKKHGKARGITALNKAKTHCKRGHPLSGPNLKLTSYGRACRACTQMHSRNHYLKNRAAP